MKKSLSKQNKQKTTEYLIFSTNDICSFLCYQLLCSFQIFLTLFAFHTGKTNKQTNKTPQTNHLSSLFFPNEISLCKTTLHVSLLVALKFIYLCLCPIITVIFCSCDSESMVLLCSASSSEPGREHEIVTV